MISVTTQTRLICNTTFVTVGREHARTCCSTSSVCCIVVAVGECEDSVHPTTEQCSKKQHIHEHDSVFRCLHQLLQTRS